MNLVVLIKQVPETNEVKMDEKTGTMVRDGVRSVINPLDLYAIEKAVLLKEKHGGKVTVVSMGPPRAIDAVKEAIAMGADEGILVSDKQFSGADTWATAYVLAEALRKLSGIDLVLCGERATDGDTGQVGPCLAAMLNFPVLTYLSQLDLEGRKIKAKRLVESGYECYECSLPAVVTVVKELCDPRLPTLSGKMKAKTAKILNESNETLQLDSEKIGLKGSPTRVVKIFRPTIVRQGEKIIVKKDEDIEKAVNSIFDYLVNNNLFAGVKE